MSREILLRAWDTHNKVMFPHETLNYNKFCLEFEDGKIYTMPLIQYLLQYQGEGGQNNLIIQEWTGSTDKNKTKIYEGDIVLWNNPDPYDGDDFLVKTVGYNNRTMSYRLYTFPEDIGEKAGSSFFPEEVEIIGNIFEGAKKDGVDYGQWRIKK